MADFASLALESAQSVEGLPEEALAIVPHLEAISLIMGVPVVPRSHPLYKKSVDLDDELDREEFKAHEAQEKETSQKEAASVKDAVVKKFIPEFLYQLKNGIYDIAKSAVLKPLIQELKVMLAVGRIAHVLVMKAMSVFVGTALSMIGTVVKFLLTNPVGWAMLTGSLLTGGVYYIFKKLTQKDTPTQTGIYTQGAVETPRHKYRTRLFEGFEQELFSSDQARRPSQGATYYQKGFLAPVLGEQSALQLSADTVPVIQKKEARTERQKRINAEAEALMQKDVFAGVTIEDTNEPFSAKAEILETMRKEGWDKMDTTSSLNYSKYGINFNKNRSKEFIRNLTPEQAIAIYKAEYWDAAGVDKVPDYLKRVYFNTAVNMGPGTAKKILARSNGTLESFMREKEKQYLMICQRNPSQYRYLRGWRNRMQAEYNETIQILREYEQRQRAAQVAQAQTVAKQPPVAQSETALIRRGKMLVAVN